MVTLQQSLGPAKWTAYLDPSSICCLLQNLEAPSRGIPLEGHKTSWQAQMTSSSTMSALKHNHDHLDNSSSVITHFCFWFFFLFF